MVEVIVGYDDRDTTRASVYFGCLDKYNAVGIGHSTLVIFPLQQFVDK